MRYAAPVDPEIMKTNAAFRPDPDGDVLGVPGRGSAVGCLTAPLILTSEDASAELARARADARAWVGTVDPLRRADCAALFARHALNAFAGIVTPTAALSEPFAQARGKLDEKARRLAASLALAASRLPMIEALHQLTSLYAALLPERQRGDRGAFYTPPPLARRLVDLAGDGGIDWKTARVLDPASGGGILLLRAARRIREALAGRDPAFILAQVGRRVVGHELDPHAASLAQNAFEVLLADLADACGRPVPTIIRVADSLEETPSETFDLVLGNPPFGRITLTPEQRVRFGRSLYGHANLYGVFTDIALRWTRPGGLIAYLTPTSMLGGQYYMALRRLLATEAPPVAIDFVHARRDVFEDVMQETLLALYRKHAKPGRFQIHHLRLGSEREATVTRNGAVSLPRRASDPWLAPREPEHGLLVAHVETMGARLIDWGYEVSTGPLVWNRFKPQLRDRPGRATYPLVWAEAVTPDGRFAFRAVKRNHQPFFKLEPGDAWLRVRDPCVLVQRTTAKEQHRRLIAAAMPAAFVDDHDGVVVENHLNMVRPIGKPAVSPAVVAAVLNSQVVDQVFRCISGSVAVSAFELQAIPLPSADEMRPIETLVKRGAERVEIEAAITALYDVGAR
jgi:adenine-specific DNA-methyltransferase